MTRGATPTFADTSYAQWIKRELHDRGWQKQDLAAALVEEAGGRLVQSGAYGLVIRVTKHGRMPDAENRALIAEVLGDPPDVEERVATLEEELGRVQADLGDIRDVKDSLARIEALLLERRVPPQDGEEAA